MTAHGIIWHVCIVLFTLMLTYTIERNGRYFDDSCDYNWKCFCFCTVKLNQSLQSMALCTINLLFEPLLLFELFIAIITVLFSHYYDYFNWSAAGNQLCCILHGTPLMKCSLQERLWLTRNQLERCGKKSERKSASVCFVNWLPCKKRKQLWYIIYLSSYRFHAEIVLKIIR